MTVEALSLASGSKDVCWSTITESVSVLQNIQGAQALAEDGEKGQGEEEDEDEEEEEQGQVEETTSAESDNSDEDDEEEEEKAKRMQNLADREWSRTSRTY